MSLIILMILRITYLRPIPSKINFGESGSSIFGENSLKLLSEVKVILLSSPLE